MSCPQPTSRNEELIRAACEAYRRVLTTRAIGPDWQEAHRAWINAAESLAVAIVNVHQQEARRHAA